MVLELLLNGIGDTVIKYNVAYVPKRITSLHKFKMPVVLHGHFPDKEGRLPSQADNCRACTAGSLITRSKKGLGSRFYNYIIKTFVRFLMAHTTHWNTHVHIWRRHRTHTHTHTHSVRPEVAVNLFSAFSHPGPAFLKDPPGAVGSL